MSGSHTLRLRLEEILVSDEFMSTQMTPGVVAIVPAIFMDFFNFLFV